MRKIIGMRVKETTNTEYSVTSGNTSTKLTIRSTNVSRVNPAEEASIVSRRCESSPLKVFPVMASEKEEVGGTEEQEEPPRNDAKETPAKNETLINEADISETPSSSKAGVENLTNLSSKISAFIDSESRNDNSYIENSTTINFKRKTKVVNAQRILKSAKSVKQFSSLQKRQKQQRQKGLTIDEKLIVQLEAKRQRMIAKFREIPNSSLTGRTTTRRKRIICRGQNNINVIRRNDRNACIRQNDDPFSDSKRKKKRKKKKIDTENHNDNDIDIDIDVAANNQNNNNDSGNNGDTIGDIDGTSVKHSNVVEIKGNADLKGNLNRKEDDDRIANVRQDSKKTTRTTVEAGKTDVQEKEKKVAIENDRSNSPIMENKDSRKLVRTENLENSVAIDPEDNYKRILKERNLDRKMLSNKTNDETISRENDIAALKNEKSRNEQPIRVPMEYPNRSGKAHVTSKSRIDQVKRDLFSDEENDRETKCARNRKTETIETSKNEPDQSNTKDLSHVLQCLQLIPACKTDHPDKLESTEHEANRKTDFNVALPNSVEYHFLYDDGAPSKKRRRRYSAHEFQINIVLNDQNNDECVKVWTATDYEEIFNIPPKSKKKLPSRKSPLKNDSHREIFDRTSVDALTVTSIRAKPLATSSPIDKPFISKTNNLAATVTSVIALTTTPAVTTTATVATPIATAINPDTDITASRSSTINEKDKIIQRDNNKRSKIEKTQEIIKDVPVVKHQKAVFTDSKESKQIEKRQHLTDPQTLLNNLDLDKFLTSVHGPA